MEADDQRLSTESEQQSDRSSSERSGASSFSEQEEQEHVEENVKELPEMHEEEDNDTPPPPSKSVTPLPGLVFITGAIEKLLSAREAKRPEVRSALEKAQKVLEPQAQQEAGGQLTRSDIDAIIDALDMLCQSKTSSANTLVIALDCVEKLISFRYFDNITDLPTAQSVAQRIQDNNSQGEEAVEGEAEMEASRLCYGIYRGIADRLVDLVSRCFVDESTADTVQLQIVKALFSLVSSSKLPVRQSSMLKAIRTVYNVFVMAKPTGNQTIAEGTLTQMVHLVLARVPVEEGEENEDTERSNDDGAARDAFLLLRALCKLSMRPISNDHAVDAKSPQLRSRCLALNLIRLAFAEHTSVFVSSYVYLQSAKNNNEQQQQDPSHTASANEDEFGDTEGPDQAISQEIAQKVSKQRAEDDEQEGGDGDNNRADTGTVAIPLIAVIRHYLSLSLSRNLVSSNSMILDLTLSILELALQHVRMYLRREMEVIFREILLPLLENKSSGSLYQRGRLLQTLGRLLTIPALVVEFYLNYDCSEDSRVNVFQRLAEVLCKLGGSYIAPLPKSSPHHWIVAASETAAANGSLDGATGSLSEGAALVSAAWRAMQQRQTVFNTPLVQVLQAAGLNDSSPLVNSNDAHHRRSSIAYSVSGSTGSQSVATATNAYSGLNFGASDKPSGRTTSPLVDDYLVRQWALDALAAMLQSMVVWSDRLAMLGNGMVEDDSYNENSKSEGSGSANKEDTASIKDSAAVVGSGGGGGGDDPQELSSIKQRKEQFETGRKLFSVKPKKGIESWQNAGFIKSSDPEDVAHFLYTHVSQGIDKLYLGEYLGDGDSYNVSVMHAFVDNMDMNDMDFVSALRLFLQPFRLPGEGQKIDRFMLKFAERYLMGNPDAGFANADAAYVLAYSTIMLNTDQHSRQVKKRMSKQEFISNNRGINDGKNLDQELLEGIFDQVKDDEIKMNDDPLESKLNQDNLQPGKEGNSSMFVLWGNNTANRIREQHAHASAAMAAKSEQSIRSMARLRRKRGVRKLSASVEANMLSPDENNNNNHQATEAGSMATMDTWAMLLDMSDYLHATRPDHIAPMFGAIWTAVLAALSSPMQTSSDPHVVAACLVGFQCCIALACRFRMPLERAAYVTTLRNFTQLQNLAEMKRKHVEAIRALIEVSASRPDVGDGLADNWMDVLQCVSQLERLQLLTQGSESTSAVSVANGRRPSSSGDVASLFGFGTANAGGPPSISARALSRQTSSNHVAQNPAALNRKRASNARTSQSHVLTVSVAELAKLETNSQVLVVTVDRLFTSSVHLSGSGIVDFVQALSQVAWSELTTTYGNDDSSADGGERKRRSSVTASSVPSRLFSLTKIVEISYYNMERIRVEWSRIWAILGPLFDRVGAYTDTRAAMFALDSLRQLSMKFLEKEELPHFAFQKEFLRPFADILEGYIPEASFATTNSSSQGKKKLLPSRNVAVDSVVKDMALRCVHQIVQAAAFHIRSGWKAILNVAQIAARDANDAIAEMGFHIAKSCAEQHGSQMWLLTTSRVSSAAAETTAVQVVSVVGIEYYHELLDCLNEFAVGAAARHRPKFALGAIDTLYGAAVALGKEVLSHPSYSTETLGDILLDDQPLYKVWIPTLRSLHEVVMHTEDLEVRTRAVDLFFALIMDQGCHFSTGMWTSILRDLVFTMFADLRDPTASRRFTTVDDLELWFSTTLIKALRHLIALFTKYYPENLSNGMMSEVLELLVLCITQPSEVLGKIGTSCLQDLIKSNYSKWDSDAWTTVCNTLSRLFNWSQPRELFTIAGASWETEQRAVGGNGAAAKTALETLPIKKEPPSQLHTSNRPSPLRTTGSASSLLSYTTDSNDTPSPGPAKMLPRANGTANGNEMDDKPDYLHITLKCILQLLLIQTIGELFDVPVDSTAAAFNSEEQEHSSSSALDKAGELYRHMSPHHLFILLDCLDKSRAFAHRFNINRKVRRRLVEMGVMPTMPSLLKQETLSVLTELHILQRMHRNAQQLEEGGELVEIDDRLATLTRIVFLQYNSAGYGREDPTLDDMNEVLEVHPVASRNVPDSASTDARRSSVITSSWRTSLLTVLAHIMVLSGPTSAFATAVSRHWPELVDTLGVAAVARDFDVVGAVQRILANAGGEMDITETKYLTPS